MIRYTQDAQQQALGFLISQTSIIEPQVYRIQYPEIQYPQLVPVETSGNQWAKSITFFSLDRFGKADWFHHEARDIPMADITREKFEKGIEMAAIGYHYTLEELQQAQMINMELTTERAGAARRAYEEFMEGVALTGGSGKGWTGLINDPNVTVVNVDADGDDNSPAFSDKTADQVLRDINALLTGVYVESLTVEMADTLLLPVAAVSALSTRRIPETTMTIMAFLRDHNVYTDTTGQPLTIRAVRALDTAGVGGTGRMVAYRRDPAVVKLHLPMPHQFLEAQGPYALRYDIPGIFRTGGVEIRRPGAVRYADHVLDEAYE